MISLGELIRLMNGKNIGVYSMIGHKSTTIVSLAEISKTKHFNLEHLFRISKYLDVDICELVHC